VYLTNYFARLVRILWALVWVCANNLDVQAKLAQLGNHLVHDFAVTVDACTLDKEDIVPWAEERGARVDLGQVERVVLEHFESVAECSWKAMVYSEHE
jgi:hypothetical protein